MLYGNLRPEPGTAAGRFHWSRLTGGFFLVSRKSKNDRMSSAGEMHYTTVQL